MNRPIKVTRLAQGIPMGSDIDYIDDQNTASGTCPTVQRFNGTH